VYKKVNNADESFGDCGVLNIDDSGSVISVGENIGKNPKANINMEMYVLKREYYLQNYEHHHIQDHHFQN
ncbi:Glucose-1-phosphate adenylyltransferase, GlgD subunit, partial [human gut metagenome]